MTISNQSASSRTSSLLPPLPSLVAGRDNSFAATLRVICDFAVTDVHTNLSGGASGNRKKPSSFEFGELQFNITQGVIHVLCR
ncbi:MAG: hypothetical protein H6635_02115 [Anaerolineales bacterium]|nr:hypothetical protein [Anaerolineales bacterium]